MNYKINLFILQVIEKYTIMCYIYFHAQDVNCFIVQETPQGEVSAVMRGLSPILHLSLVSL